MTHDKLIADAARAIKDAAYQGETNFRSIATAALAPALAEIDRLREALIDIGVYGCGMLNQPAALNGQEASWFKSRVAVMEQAARAALTPLEQTKT